VCENLAAGRDAVAAKKLAILDAQHKWFCRAEFGVVDLRLRDKLRLKKRIAGRGGVRAGRDCIVRPNVRVVATGERGVEHRGEDKKRVIAHATFGTRKSRMFRGAFVRRPGLAWSDIGTAGHRACARGNIVTWRPQRAAILVGNVSTAEDECGEHVARYRGVTAARPPRTK